MFYGDYELDIYIAAKSDYKAGGLEAAIARAAGAESGWARQHSAVEKEVHYSSLSAILCEFECVSESMLRKVFPWREDGAVLRTYQMRCNGNFKMFACETGRFYYVFCFATS
jgi:hypothetical protein